MPVEILMPALSPTMTEGKLAHWLKSEGDDVAAGDVIAEIETDKATMEVEAVDEGKLGRILVAEGTENVAVNTPIAVIVGEGEIVDDATALLKGSESSNVSLSTRFISLASYRAYSLMGSCMYSASGPSISRTCLTVAEKTNRLVGMG